MSHEQVQLGRPIEGECHRDAIHVAVFPAVCDQELRPGDPIRVGIARQGNLYHVSLACHREAHGVVDPFLQGPLPPGTPFYGLLKPGTVTALRHVYSHPAFQVATPRLAPQPLPAPEWTLAE